MLSPLLTIMILLWPLSRWSRDKSLRLRIFFFLILDSSILIWWSLETYMIINFRSYKISWGMVKLVWISMLIKNKIIILLFFKIHKLLLLHCHYFTISISFLSDTTIIYIIMILFLLNYYYFPIIYSYSFFYFVIIKIIIITTFIIIIINEIIWRITIYL